MTKKVSQPLTEHYVVPARQLSGTRAEVLAQIDELILGLTGLRQLVSLHGPTPAEAPRRKLQLVKRFFPGRLGDADLRQVQNTALVGGVWWFGTTDGVWQEGVCCSRLEWWCWVLRHSSHWSRSLSCAIACRW